MVGALSIVRFRTPVKDSMDLIFLFWAISTGIANGVGYYNIAIIGSAMIAAFLLFLTKMGKTPSDIFLLILQFSDPASEKAILDQIKLHADQFSIKSKTVTDGSTEITIEIQVSGRDTEFINKLQEGGKVNRATMVSYDQDLSAV
jgi:uncharacterized membrane protein YhiD involved in acid resistance